jgi:hypothetical protein
MEPAFKAIADLGVAVVALVALGTFGAWLIRDYVADLKQQRDAALELAKSVTSAIEKLTDAVEAETRARR